MPSSCTSRSSSWTRSWISRLLGRCAPRPHAQAEGDVLEDAHVAEQRVVLEDEADAAVARAALGRVLAVEEHVAGVGELESGDDAQQRRLARARRPEQRDQLAFLHLEVHRAQRGEGAETLGDAACFDAHALLHSNSRARRASHAPLEDALHDQRHHREQREQRRHREGRRTLVLVVEDLDVQRHRVGLSADVPGDDRDGAELAHRARVQQHDPVEQAEADVRQRHAAEDLEAARAERDRGFLLLRCPAPASAGSARARRTGR